MTWQDFVGAQVYVIPCGFVDFEFPVFRLYEPYRMSATLVFSNELSNTFTCRLTKQNTTSTRWVHGRGGAVVSVR